MLSTCCRRAVHSSSVVRYSSKAATCGVADATSSSTTANTAASALASKKKQHQLFLLNRCTMAAATKPKQPAPPATATTSPVRQQQQPQAAANIQQPSNRQFHSYSSSSSSSFSSSSSSSSSWQRRTFTTTSSTQEARQQQAKKRTFMEWYEVHLQAHPVLTKMFTGSLLWGIGDAVAQIVPQVAFTNDEEKKEKEQSSSSPDTVVAVAESFGRTIIMDNKASKATLTYDWLRTGRAALFGFALHAPTSHVHFNFLEWLTHRLNVTGNFAVPIFKAFMEQFVYWSWISNSMYHGAMGAMQGMSIQQIYDRIADVLWETQKAQWVFWIPVQLLNFRFVPVRHQLNVVLVTSIVWTALLSAWYPPQEDDNKKKEEEEEDNAKPTTATVDTANKA